MAITRRWKVYGRKGHNQRKSFYPSYVYDWSTPNNTRIVKIHNSDITGTNEYSILIITRNTAEECEDEMLGQVSDGIFENSWTGKVEEI